MIIDNEHFHVLPHEYNKFQSPDFCNINILLSLNIHQRIIALIQEIVTYILYKQKYTFLSFKTTHGGYIPIKLAQFFSFTYIFPLDDSHTQNIYKNIQHHNLSNITNIITQHIDADFSFNTNDLINSFSKFIITTTKFDSNNPFIHNYTSFSITDTEFYIYIHHDFIHTFNIHFSFFILPNFILNFDNLIHYTMIVKNAGDDFRNILTHNLPFFDTWTILDTGSTDNTIYIIKDVLKNKKGNLYQEPFINFKDSRNRCLDLAGNSSKFIIMLDDTYKIQGNLRPFLQTVRADQLADSFSIFIKSYDTEYGSNRIIKSSSNLRYIYKIHEVIDPNNNYNVIIPSHHAYIEDISSNYMNERTFLRKKQDIFFLNQELNENPDDPRSLYYLGQTYSLLKQFKKAYDYFLLRVNHHNQGFLQEKIDACFEAARIANFRLKLHWDSCLTLYLKAYHLDTTRPDSLYFIGIHYFMIDNFDLAYKYFKDAFTVSYPQHCQYSLKPTLSFYFLPQFLAQVAFRFNNYQLVLQCTQLFFQKNEFDENDHVHFTMKCFQKIVHHIYDSSSSSSIIQNPSINKNIIFLADGGFNQWTGADIHTKGIGGSETFIIQISQHLKSFLPQYYNIFVFCQCSKQQSFNNVQYFDLSFIHQFIQNHTIHHAFVSRYPEYLPFLYQNNNVQNVHLILHDLIRDGEIIIENTKLKNIICLSLFHKQLFDNMFNTLNHLSSVFSYGIDELFLSKDTSQKIPLRFIYSSFPDRGLLQLLQMWKSILSKYPYASLVIHCDLDNTWVNTHHSKTILQIKSLLKLMEFNHNIFFQGWVNKYTLANNWLQADIWLYPCVFLETFCLTSLEAALSKTLVITSNLGSLPHVVKSGIIIDGDPSTATWKNKALENLFQIIQNPSLKQSIVQQNFTYASNLLWKNRAKDFTNFLQNENEILLK